MILGAAGIGFVCGIVITALGMILFMPKMMLITQASTMGFDETVSAIEQSIARNGWTSPGTIDLCKSMQKHGVECPRRVTVVQLCHPALLAEVPQVLTDCQRDGIGYESHFAAALNRRLAGSALFLWSSP